MGSPSVGRVRKKNLNFFLPKRAFLTHPFSSFTKHTATANEKHFAVNSPKFITGFNLVSVS